MADVRNLARFRVPLGGQEIELAEIVHVAGAMPLLRVRIRERSRFTIFDVDPETARQWAAAMRSWADAQPAGSERRG